MIRFRGVHEGGKEVVLLARSVKSETSLALIARDEVSAIRESKDVYRALRGTALTVSGSGGVSKVFERLKGKKLTLFRLTVIFLSIKSSSEGTHQSRYCGTHYILSRFKLKGTKDRVV